MLKFIVIQSVYLVSQGKKLLFSDAFNELLTEFSLFSLGNFCKSKTFFPDQQISSGKYVLDVRD